MWIKDPAGLLQIFNSLPNHYIFRGQADADWSLTSSLERTVGNSWSAVEARKYEELSSVHFKAKFHLYDRENLAPDSELAWFALMQHYGVPTRLLDFTVSPFVALYFALETYRAAAKKNLSVYALDWKAAMEVSMEHIRSADANFRCSAHDLTERPDQVFDTFVNPRSYDIVWITEPRKHNQRLDKQAGCFLVSGNRDKRIEDVLNSTAYHNVDVTKYVIDHEIHSHVFAILRKINLNGKVLYGDLHGLATAIRMEMQAYSGTGS